MIELRPCPLSAGDDSLGKELETLVHGPGLTVETLMECTSRYAPNIGEIDITDPKLYELIQQVVNTINSAVRMGP